MDTANDSAPALQHLAIIPDGNRRWARQHMLTVWQGHQKGSEILDNLLDVVIESGIPHFSFWGSSQDNLTKRPKEEVRQLLKIFREQFTRLATMDKIHANRIRINILGSWREQFPEEVKLPMLEAIEKTRDYAGRYLNFFIAYSGTDEVLKATDAIAGLKAADPRLEVTPELFKSQLLTKDLPPVDLLIRTGGEPHNSDGFMMWDMADAQYYFTPKLWPDFNSEDLRIAIKDFSTRERRLGK